MLGACDRPLSQTYDLAVLDLDGVVYVGPDAVRGAPEHLTAARDAGMTLAFVTNNAARPPQAVADHLSELGVPCEAADVVTSAQAAARLLAARLDPGSAVFVIGGQGLESALEERGLRPVTSVADHPVAVAQGYGPDMPWRRVVAGAILVKDGLPWVATNTDGTIPTAAGVGPGNGALVDLVARFAEREPVVAGKPEAPLFEETLIRVGGERPLMIGDRLDTDILGAREVGWDSLLVLTGVTGVAELASAAPDQRPTYIASDLSGLARAQVPPEVDDGRVTGGGWTATVRAGRLEVSGDGDPDTWWQTVAVAAWQHLDTAGEAPDVSDLHPPEH